MMRSSYITEILNFLIFGTKLILKNMQYRRGKYRNMQFRLVFF